MGNLPSVIPARRTSTTALAPQAIARQRRNDFHHESAFIRYAIVSTSGTLPGVPPLDFASRVKA